MSAIIPTFNRASLVCDAIDSVRLQSYGNVEIVVVDDGSTDDTEARLQRYGAQIRVIRQNNAGPSAARNRGIQASRGELVAFLDSDDTWKPQKLEHQIRILEAAGARVPCCVCNAVVDRPDGRPSTTFEYAGLRPPAREGVWHNVAEMLARQFLMFTQMAVVRRNILERIGGFDEQLWVLEDYDLALRLSLEGPWAYTSEPLAIYREESPGSLGAAGRRNELLLLKRAIKIRENFSDAVRASDSYRHLRHASSLGLRTFRRELRALELLQHSLWTYSFLARGLLCVERFRRALSRRTPWYPKMKVAAIGSRSDAHSGAQSAIHVH